ncbi:GFA family protein [Roseomonas sp. CCTCC AB2023176]|uniref:GFA family protein n=1 Tax=Roseomonas sp. CCTCC AB2023176 TaxID=3342640 RepID=UPI0035DA5068
MEARCGCGALTVRVPGRASMVVACHCTECQRRTGSPFGVGAFYRWGDVEITGAATEFARDGAAGGKVRTSFCPTCGSAVYWRADRAPGLVAIAVGCFNDPAHPEPNRSIWERSGLPWATVIADQHLPGGSRRSDPVTASPLPRRPG